MNNLLLGATFSVLTGITPPTAGVQAVVSVHLGHAHGEAEARRAFDAGFRRGSKDGARAGRSDARHHRRFGLERHARYRSGDCGYRHRFGPRGAYADGFRLGFERAYRRAYSHHSCRRCAGSRHHR